MFNVSFKITIYFLFFSDEATFTKHGNVNLHNMHFFILEMILLIGKLLLLNNDLV